MENPGYDDGNEDIPHHVGEDDDDPTDQNPPRFPTGEGGGGGVEQVLEHLLYRKEYQEVKSHAYRKN